MQGLRKLGVNVTLQVLIKLLAVGLGIFTARWLNKNLLPSEYESYNLVLSYTPLILGTISFGISNIIQKVYTHKDDKDKIKDFWTTLNTFRILTYVVGLVLIAITSPLSQTNNLGYIVAIFSAQFILFADLNYRAVVDAKGKSWQFSITDFIGKLVLISSIYFILPLVPNIFKLNNLSAFITISILANLFSYGLDFLWQKKYTPIGVFKISILGQYKNEMLYLAVVGIVENAYLITDKLYLKFFNYNSFAINGYANAYKLLEIASIIPNLTMPVLASFLVKKMISKENFAWRPSALLSFLVGLTIAIGFLFTAPIFLKVIDPSNYYFTESIKVIPILSIVLIMAFPISLLSFLSILLNGEKNVLFGSLTMFVVYHILYITLIPPFGIIGAAIASGIGSTIDSLVRAFLFRKILLTYIKTKLT